MSELKIRKDPCELDFLSLGALVHRLDPGVIPFRKSRSFDIHVSGGEYNVAAGLADCFGLKDRHRDGHGQLSDRRNRAEPSARNGRDSLLQMVRARWRSRAQYRDRLQRPRLRCAPAVVFYNRANEAGALLKPGDFDWAGIFGRGVRWFHSGGIFAALSETTAPLIVEAMQAAQGVRCRHVVRSQLSRQTLGSRRRRRAWPAGHQKHRHSPRCTHRKRRGPSKRPRRAGTGSRGQVEPRSGHVLRAHRPRHRASSQHQACGHDPSRSAFDQPARLGGRALAQRQEICQPDARARRVGPHRRR